MVRSPPTSVASTVGDDRGVTTVSDTVVTVPTTAAISTTAAVPTFGTAADVTASELTIETFCRANPDRVSGS